MTLLKELAERVEKNEFVEIKPGVYLCSAEHMKGLDDESTLDDDGQPIDFDDYPYWGLDNTGWVDGFNDIDEALKIIFK